MADADWLGEGWLEAQIDGAAAAFGRAFDRWRELYNAAVAQLLAAQQQQLGGFKKAGKASRGCHQRRRDVNARGASSARTSDLPERAGGGVGLLRLPLPGQRGLPARLQFPRPARPRLHLQPQRGRVYSRPRFLAINEFAPDNVIYHEGAKYQVSRVWLPIQDPEKRFVRAKLCQNCGYLHEGEAVNDEKCRNCGSSLECSGCYVAHLLEMPTVGTQRRDRITSDEEERMRMGYDTRTNFRFAQGPAGELRRRLASVRGTDGGQVGKDLRSPLLDLVYAPAATLWRINHGWRRRQVTGYRLDISAAPGWVRMRHPTRTRAA